MENKKGGENTESPPPGVGWVLRFKPFGGNRSACPARQACISLAVRDCHRERDSPPEGLSFGFSNTGERRVSIEKERYSEIILWMQSIRCAQLPSETVKSGILMLPA